MRRTRPLLMAALAAVLLGVSPAVALAQAAPEPPPFGCREGWVPVERPVNPALKCLPNEVAAGATGGAGAPEPPPFGCPDGWVRVDPPLNPVIQCLPDTITSGPPSRG